MGGGLESGCVGRVYGADGAVKSSWHFKLFLSKLLSIKSGFSPAIA